MKLSNQNICNLRGCQMPLGGGANHFWGSAHPPTDTHRKSVPEAVLMYKILNDHTAQLKKLFSKRNEAQILKNLQNIETDVTLPNPNIYS